MTATPAPHPQQGSAEAALVASAKRNERHKENFSRRDLGDWQGGSGLFPFLCAGHGIPKNCSIVELAPMSPEVRV